MKMRCKTVDRNNPLSPPVGGPWGPLKYSKLRSLSAARGFSRSRSCVALETKSGPGVR